MRDVRNVRGGTQKKMQKLRQLLSGLLSELTYFDEVYLYFLGSSLDLPLLSLDILEKLVDSTLVRVSVSFACILLNANMFVFEILSQYDLH